VDVTKKTKNIAVFARSSYNRTIMDTLTTIIVHFNTPQETTTCLRSLVKSNTSSFNHTIIVVDNGSKELYQIPEDLKKNKNKIALLRSEANLGFAGGNNLGISHAMHHYGADYVVLLNSDTTVDPKALEILVTAARSKPEAGLLNPKIYFTKNMEFHQHSYTKNEKGNVLWFAGGSIDWKDVASFHRGVDEVDRGQCNTSSETDFATGCCVLIKREVLETVGLLSEDLFLYWEDVEYSLRVKKSGYSLFYIPEAKVWHDNAGSSDGAGNEVSIYYQTRNRLYLAFTHGGVVAKKAAARLTAQFLQGSAIEKKAALDATTGQMGKQPLA
jgi:GT2 family glycosyltransferase